MIRGLYTSATGMLTQQKKMDVISNNIANVDTTGFKKDGVVIRSFEEELTRRINDKTEIEGIKFSKGIGGMSLGSYVQNTYTDFSSGSIKQTGNTLDIALDFDGFFAVNFTNKNGETAEKYTRDGAFTLSADGTLVTKDGTPVAGLNGNIQLPPGDIIISDTGDIYVDGVYTDQIKIVSFQDNTTLRKFGHNLLDTTEESQQQPYNGRVLQGCLEGSNVSSVNEMVNMISMMRNYEINQKLIQIHDQTLGKAVNEIK